MQKIPKEAYRKALSIIASFGSRNVISSSSYYNQYINYESQVY
jgi:hypothetical protein